ncbi:MAG TPA: DUF2279 domain-containing protein [Bacteroidota bacterium]|nr:DUF2279 domain-containing protein [Bacteroidota bacterium]
MKRWKMFFAAIAGSEVILTLLLGSLPTRILAQDSTNIQTGRLLLVGGVTAASVALVDIYQRDAWWQGEREPFRFENDWEYALNIDKLGHAYGGYSEAKLARSVLQWTGISERASIFYGTAIGLAYQTYVEIEDGYHKSYGFSPGDEFSDIVGACIPMAQESFPVLKNFSFKFSYYPSNQYLNDLRSQTFRVFIDDYEGSVYWITMDPHFLLGKDLSRIVPDWLGLAAGFGVHNLNDSGTGSRLYFLTLDYNFSRIETRSDFLKALFGAMDFFHFPSPGMAIQDSKLKFGIFYTYHVQLTL